MERTNKITPKIIKTTTFPIVGKSHRSTNTNFSNMIEKVAKLIIRTTFRCNRIPTAICIKPARLNEIEKPALNSSGKPN